MNDFQLELLWRIVNQFGFGSNPTKNEFRFQNIVETVRPWYESQDWLLDETILYQQLNGIVEEGYLETTNYVYRLTVRALIYREAWLIIPSMVGNLFERQQNEFDAYRKSVAIYQWGGIGLAILTSGIALVIVLAR